MKLDFAQLMAQIYRKKSRGESLTDDEMVFWLVHRALIRDDYEEINMRIEEPKAE